MPTETIPSEPEVTMLADLTRYRHDPTVARDADGYPIIPSAIPTSSTPFGDVIGQSMRTAPAAPRQPLPAVTKPTEQIPAQSASLQQGVIDFVLQNPEAALQMARQAQEQRDFDYANKDITDQLLRDGLITVSQIPAFTDPNTGKVTRAYYERVSGQPLRVASEGVYNAGVTAGDFLKRMFGVIPSLSMMPTQRL
jgi:hypothetical protein